MQEKMEDAEFTNDMQSLLRPGITFNASDAYPLIYETFIDKMEGKRCLQQLNLDHANDFDILLKIERLNDTSFKLIFGDVKGNSVSKWKVAHNNWH